MAAAEEANLRAPPGMGEPRHEHREPKEQEPCGSACSSALQLCPRLRQVLVLAARAARRMARARGPVFVCIPILIRFSAVDGCSLAHARDPKPLAAWSRPVPRWRRPQVLPVCNLEPLHASSGRRSQRSPSARAATLQLRHRKGHRHLPHRCFSIFLPVPGGCRKARGGSSVPTQWPGPGHRRCSSTTFVLTSQLPSLQAPTPPVLPRRGPRQTHSSQQPGRGRAGR